MNEKIREFKEKFPNQDFIQFLNNGYNSDELFDKECWHSSRSGLRLNAYGYSVWNTILKFQSIEVEMTTKGLVYLIKHNHAPWYVDTTNISNVPRFKTRLYLSDTDAAFSLIMSEDICKI